MEKADILEMTVKHVQQIANQSGSSGDELAKYKAGFTKCASEVSNFLNSVSGFPADLHKRLQSHLSSATSSINKSFLIQNKNLTHVTSAGVATIPTLSSQPSTSTASTHSSSNNQKITKPKAIPLASSSPDSQTDMTSRSTSIGSPEIPVGSPSSPESAKGNSPNCSPIHTSCASSVTIPASLNQNRNYNPENFSPSTETSKHYTVPVKSEANYSQSMPLDLATQKKSDQTSAVHQAAFVNQTVYHYDRNYQITASIPTSTTNQNYQNYVQANQQPAWQVNTTQVPTGYQPNQRYFINSTTIKNEPQQTYYHTESRISPVPSSHSIPTNQSPSLSRKASTSKALSTNEPKINSSHKLLVKPSQQQSKSRVERAHPYLPPAQGSNKSHWRPW